MDKSITDANVAKLRVFIAERELRDRLRAAADVESISLEIARYAVSAGFQRCRVVLNDDPGSSLTEERAPENEKDVVIPLADSDGAIGAICCGGEPAENEVAAARLRDVAPDVTLILRLHLLRRIREAEKGRLLRDLQRRNEEMLDELEQAREFQSQMLSRTPVVDGITIHTFYRPHDAVSGDFYDLFWNGETLRIFLADTTGHGVRGGLATMLLKAEYETIRREAKTPAAVLVDLNDRIAKLYRSGTLTLTAVCVDLVPETGAVTFASAAHPSPILISGDAKSEELPSGGSFIGLVPDLDLVFGSAVVEADGGLYVYTDGISEATSSTTGELFGEARIIAAITDAHTKKLDPARSLAKAAETFCRPGSFADDLAILGLRRSSR